MHSIDFGTYKHGRLTYRTAEEARAVAEELGLSDVHSHMVNGERVFMPGTDHESLNNALQRRGMQPVSPPTVRGYGGEKSAGLGFDLGMDGDGFL